MPTTEDIKKWLQEANQWWKDEQKKRKEMGYMLEDLPEDDNEELHF